MLPDPPPAPLNDGEWEPLPTYAELLRCTYSSVMFFGFNSSLPYSVPEDWEFAKSLLLRVPRSEVLQIVVLAVTLTVTRGLLSAYLFEPLARFLRLTPTDSAKFPESAWKLFAYSILYGLSFYTIVISDRHDYLQRPTRIWNFTDHADYYSRDLPTDIYTMYILQIAFYFHSIYATIYMDVWRKDSVTMLFHHGLTLFLLQFSFLIRYHKIGALVLFLHDISDVFLEFTKINVYLKHRGGRYYLINDVLSSVGFVAFALSWAFFRLYWFPLKVLYSTTWGVYIHQSATRGPRLFLFFNTMLWMLLALHIYWFWFILVLMYRIATGQLKEIDDTREYDSGQGSSGEDSAGECVNGCVSGKLAKESSRSGRSAGECVNGRVSGKLAKESNRSSSNGACVNGHNDTAVCNGRVQK